jgi:hypothetical protein
MRANLVTKSWISLSQEARSTLSLSIMMNPTKGQISRLYIRLRYVYYALSSTMVTIRRHKTRERVTI